MTVKPTLDFGDAIKLACNRIVETKGRSRRSEFWWAALVAYIVSIFVPVVQLAMIPITIRRLHDTGRSGWWLLFPIVASVLITVMMIVDYCAGAVMVADACMNDEEMVKSLFTSGAMIGLLVKWMFIVVAALIYDLVMLVFLCQDSEPFENKYGPSPKHMEMPPVPPVPPFTPGL